MEKNKLNQIIFFFCHIFVAFLGQKKSNQWIAKKKSDSNNFDEFYPETQNAHLNSLSLFIGLCLCLLFGLCFFLEINHSMNQLWKWIQINISIYIIITNIIQRYGPSEWICWFRRDFCIHKTNLYQEARKKGRELNLKLY